MGIQKLIIGIAIAFVFTATDSDAQTKADSILPSVFDYLADADSLELTVTTDIRSLLKKKDEYQDAEIDFKAHGKEVLYVEGEIRTRGNARKEICYVPPTKLRFDKDFLKKLGFSTYPTLKLVNSCTLADHNETYVDVERMIYQFDRLFTDLSFRTIPVHIRYVDSNKKKKEMSFRGFLIEHEDQLADRAGGKIYEASLFKEENLIRESYLLFSMFQYMVGNTDWKVLNKHNLKILRIPEKREIHAIAYDFDYAGLVNTHYAVPHETLPIKSVRERLYLGPCLTEEELPHYCELFLSKRNQIRAILASHKMAEKPHKYCERYLDDFFELLQDERRAKATFIKCRHDKM
ncbi:MAG: hypothetical protein KTR24_08235 [Saprospiraceae bacterium]|nr:hypothetical protein [Saprospiraceae bacterium]